MRRSKGSSRFLRSSSALLLAAALTSLPAGARADIAQWDFATPGPELGLGIGIHALATAALVTFATELVVSSSIGGVTPLGGYNGISTTSLTLLTITTSLLLPVLSGSSIYALQRNNRLWRVQPGFIFLAGVVPEAIAQTYYATVLHNYTLQGGITAPNLFPKLVTAQIAAVVLTPVVQVVVTHLLREPDPDH